MSDLAEAILRVVPTAGGFAGALVNACGQFGIDTKDRQAAFLAQCAHESGGFLHLVENLNYGAQSLASAWPIRFAAHDDVGKILYIAGRPVPNSAAKLIEHQPEKIANIVYANRLGNSDTASGDGWRYRGRGLIQLTGVENYAACSQSVYRNDDRLLTSPELLEQPPAAALSAAWFWQTRALNELADQADDEAFERITKKVNGGLVGLSDRREWWAKFKDAIS